MSSVVYNNNSSSSVAKTNAAAGNELFPTTIGSATKMYRYQHIMPAPQAADSIKTRKYIPRSSVGSPNSLAVANVCSGNNGGGAPYSVDQSQSVQRRNARERNRVKQVNNSFARLRQHIPQSIIADLTKGGGRGPHKKISKVDTLRIAVEYIRRLQDLVDDLNGGGAGSGNNIVPLSVSSLCHADDDDDDDDDDNSQSSQSSHSTASSLSASSYLAVAAAAQQLSTPAQPQPQLYYAATTTLQQQQQLQRQQYPNQPLTPISLNAVYSSAPACLSATLALAENAVSCHSPTSSFNSSMSFDSGTYDAAPQQLSPNNVQVQPAQMTTTTTTTTQLDTHLQLKFEPYEHFQLDEEDCTPDDEEILDYISLWQEQ